MRKLCRKISKEYKFDYDLGEILSMLVVTRALFPGSKRSSLESYQSFLEHSSIQEQQVYRALDVLAKHRDDIQAELYQNSQKILPRKSSILYYDCTNFFFEIDQADGFREYGISKEHRPNPLVQMGLFTDANGIPLAFSLQSGNQNEQLSLKPLERKILSDFGCADFVVCTDAGLSSQDNRAFKTRGGRAFITTQSVKQLKKFLREWALDPDGWKLAGCKASFSLAELDEQKDYDKIFYKELWINENNFSQRLIVSYSLKYRHYNQEIRQGHIDRAIAAMRRGKQGSQSCFPNDYRRFIKSLAVTDDGEVAENARIFLNEALIQKEAMYDGFYAVCTNLEGDIQQVLNVNKRRWQIESCFRVMKTDFSSRPVYLQKKGRIEAHFLTCFMALVLVRILEQLVNCGTEHYTTSQLLKTLSNMKLKKVGKDYVPHYTRTNLTDRLHQIFGFRTDRQVMTGKQIQSILKKPFAYEVKAKN